VSTPGPAHEDEVLGKAYDARLARRMLPYIIPQARLIALSVVLMFVVMGSNLLGPYLLKLLFDEHILKADRHGVAALALVYLLAITVELLARYGQLYSMELTGQNVILNLRDRVFRHLLSLDSAFFDRSPLGRLMTRVTTDIEALADLFSSGVVSLLGDSVKLIAIVVILVWLDWRLACVTFAMTPVLFLLSAMLRGRIRQAYRDVRRRIARINAYVQETVSGMVLVQLFRREEVNRREFDAINSEHRDAELRSVIYESGFSAIIEMVGNVATALILWYGGGEMLRNALTLGTLVAFLNYTSRFFGPIQDLSGFYAVLQAAMASLERIFALLDERPSITSPLLPAALPERGEGRIEFADVRFAYRAGEEVLHGISLRVEPGEKVAIVGATGSGKTTLIKLLIRLYEPASGSIRMDDRDVRSLPLPYLRRQVGVVQQDHFLFTGTIASNIGFGRPDLARDRLERAARLVHADRFVRELPDGYNAGVRERGNNLSVGQKQLLSFARALAYDPAVLVLDEATSSVDTETEVLIQDGLRLLLQGRTSIVIAHRLSTIVGADRILVMHHGRIAEQGTHHNLLQKRGIYHRLYQLQFSPEAGTSGEASSTVPEVPTQIDPATGQ
jgi:ATP-binding cassette subfamily B multidrug efflux pump